MSIVNCTKIMSGYLCLQRRLSQLSEGIEIINRILPYVTGHGKRAHFVHYFKIELLVFKGSVDLKQ